MISVCKRLVVSTDIIMDTKIDTQIDTKSVKTFDSICDMILFAKQCMSQDLDVSEYTTCQNIRKTLKYIGVDALILTIQSMIIKNPEKVSNVIFCVDGDVDCVCINNKYNYMIYYSPTNKPPSLLIQRLLSIHYPKADITILTSGNDNNNLYHTSHWISVLLFVTTTSTHQEYHSTELIDTVSKQFKDHKFIRIFDEFCNIVTSNQSSVTRIDTSRPRGVNNLTNKASQNLNKILDILYDIVDWSCCMIKDDESVRSTKVYCNLIHSIAFEKVKKHIKISKTMVHETVIKLWNRLNYELTLNVDNVQLIKTTFQNIIHCLITHYKYVVYVFINLLQSNNEDNIICRQSFVIVKLTEEYDEKIRSITTLADDMNSLICDVIARCSK